jgi:hypothetical protein
LIDFLLIIFLLILLYFILLNIRETFFKEYTLEDFKLILNKFSDIVFKSLFITIGLSILLRVFDFDVQNFNFSVFILALLFFASVSFLYDVFVLAYKKDIHPKTSTGSQWVEKKYIKSISTGVKISIVRASSALVVSFIVYSLFSVVVSVVATYMFFSLAFFLIVIEVYYFFENHKKDNFIIDFGAGIIPSPYILPIVLFLILSGYFWSAIVFSFLGSLILEIIVIKNAIKSKKPKKKPAIVDTIAGNFPKLNQYFLYFLLAYCILYLIYILYAESETLLMILYRIH